ncbi:MAG: rod shape-determining protein [Candidatus Saccharimonadales bacterium]|nr:rod shape-determining protein [Candidatus Saccharimonadales bacterium]
MRRKLTRYWAHDIAIDLGTANTLVWVAGKGLVVNEPSVVAFNKKTKKIVAIGEKAKQMIGRAPKQIRITKPLVDGVVSDFEVTEQMLRYFIDKVHRIHRVIWPRPRIIIGLPSGVTEVEQRAVEEAARSAGARRIFLIEEPIAAAIGSGLDVLGNGGHMVVDIGGGTTEIAVLSVGGVVALKSLRIAGDELTEAVQQYIRDEFGVQIGEQTAENLKTSIGAVYVHADPKTEIVRGRNVISGLPMQIEISSDLLRIPLMKQTRPIIEAVKAALEEAPAELIGDIMQSGIVLTGGGSLIAGMDHLVKQETKIETTIGENALTAVVEGSAMVLDDLDQLRRVLLSEMKG